jgi:hypothetical protein
MKFLMIFVIIFTIFIFGCQPVLSVNNSTPIASPTQTSIPRWMAYERALSKAVVNTSDGLCEWKILGKSEQEVYVWTECRVREPIGSAGSVPAVIRLAKNGEIEQVIIPRDGMDYSADVQSMFPVGIQEKIFNPTFNGPAAEAHIDERLKTNGPPLIVVDGTPLP